MKINLLLFCFVICTIFSCSNKIKGLYCAEDSKLSACIYFSGKGKFHYTEFADNSKEGFGTYTITKNQLQLFFTEGIECKECLTTSKEKMLTDSVVLIINNLTQSQKNYTLDISDHSSFGFREDIYERKHLMEFPFHEKIFVIILDSVLPAIELEIDEPGKYEVDFQFPKHLEHQIVNSKRTYHILKKDKAGMTIEWDESSLYKFELKKNYESKLYQYWKPYFR